MKKKVKRVLAAKTRRHRGKRAKTIVTALGKVGFKRVYRECRRCLIPIHAADEVLGLESRYGISAHRLT